MTLLWEFLWKTSAVILAVWLGTLLLRHRSAALRHALWLGGLTAFLCVPALFPLARRTPAVRLPAYLPVALETLPVQLSVTASQPGPRKPPARTLPVSWILMAVWVGGTLVICIRRGRAAFRMQRIAGRSSPAPSHLAAPDEPAIGISHDVRTPLTWGLIHPMILLPASALDWQPECLRSVLEHEREHIRRWDSVSHWLAELVCAVWWFHPLAWLARSRAAHERECACDDAVLRSGVRASDYASELLNLAATLPIKGEPIMALSALSDFERRIKNLLLPGIDRRPANQHARWAVALATVALIVPLAVLRAQAPSGQADLSGTVTDVTGAVVPDAWVVASGSGGNREIARTNAVGEWSLSGIPVGNYTVEVRARGFSIASKPIALAPGQRATLDQTVNVGQMQETINVTAQGQARHAVAQADTSPQRIRVGGMVQASRLIRQVKPAYPESAKAQGIEGTVLLNAVIGTDGKLISLKVINKLADSDLAAAAMQAVQQWQYQPTLLNGEPVEVVTTITVNFTLQN